MWEWTRRQVEAERDGKAVEKRMFRPLVNLVLSYPELEDCLNGQ
jgi:8-oxo-dGTP diphosphatase